MAAGNKLSIKAARYARKLEKRHNVLALSSRQFLEDEKLVDKDIWELGYASTSDEDDNDELETSSEEYDSEDDDDDDDDDEKDTSEEKKQAALLRSCEPPELPFASTATATDSEE